MRKLGWRHRRLALPQRRYHEGTVCLEGKLSEIGIVRIATMSNYKLTRPLNLLTRLHWV